MLTKKNRKTHQLSRFEPEPSDTIIEVSHKLEANSKKGDAQHDAEEEQDGDVNQIKQKCMTLQTKKKKLFEELECCYFCCVVVVRMPAHEITQKIVALSLLAFLELFSFFSQFFFIFLSKESLLNSLL